MSDVYVAKILQALGLADVGYALFVGISKNFSMAEEIVLALIGLGSFLRAGARAKVA